jgi:putative peptidoglycan lipid II flippase
MKTVMEKFVNRTKKLIFHQQKDILSSALILSFMSLVARIFGLLRIRTLTLFFTGPQTDYLLASFRIPDLIFEILITGVLSSAFIPLFIKYGKDKKSLYTNISSIINFIILALIFFTIIIFLGADVIFPLFITPGFSPTEAHNVIYLSRIVLVTQLPFLVLGYIISGMAQANRIFIVTAFAQVLYGLGAIIGTVLFSQTFGIMGPIIGVSLGAILLFLVQLPTIFAIDFHYEPFARKKTVIVEFVKLFTPRLLSVIATQIDLTVDLALASFLTRGDYTAFYYAQRLQFFPVSFFGVSFGQASLPYLSELYRNKRIAEFKKIFVDSILQLLFVALPIAVIFIFARTPIIRIVFGGPKFSFEATSLTALALSYFAISIPLHTLYYFIVRAFYATYDTKTPFLISVFSSIVNTTLSLFFIFILHKNIAFLAMSFSLSITVNVLLSLIFFYKKMGGFDIRRLVRNCAKILTCGFLSALVTYPIMKITQDIFLENYQVKLLIVYLNIFLIHQMVNLTF